MAELADATGRDETGQCMSKHYCGFESRFFCKQVGSSIWQSILLAKRFHVSSGRLNGSNPSPPVLCAECSNGGQRSVQSLSSEKVGSNPTLHIYWRCGAIG